MIPIFLYVFKYLVLYAKEVWHTMLSNMVTLFICDSCHFDLKIEKILFYRTKFLYSICHIYIFDDRSENQSKDKHKYFFGVFNVFELLF